MDKNQNIAENCLSHLDGSAQSALEYHLKRLGFNEGSILSSFIGELCKENALIYLVKSDMSELEEDMHHYAIEWRNDRKSSWARGVLHDIVAENDFKSNRKPYLKSAQDGDGHKFRTIIDFLVEYKKQDYVTASDISNYIFCPASLSISKSFSEPEKSKEAVSGTELHEQNRLVWYAVRDKSGVQVQFSDDTAKEGIYSKQNEAFFRDVRNSSILYVGHDDNAKKYFMSSKGKYVGQPDYVFTNSKGQNFIVEEKFRLLKKEVTSPQLTHKAQLNSYIMGLDELKADYGYLVYWHYESVKYRKVIKKCTVFRVEKSADEQAMIRSVYSEILKLNSGYILDFDISKLEARKCMKCSVRKFCGHKTGRFNYISLPYNSDYYALIGGGVNGWSK